MSAEQPNVEPKTQKTNLPCEMSRQSSVTPSTRKAECQQSRCKRKLSFQDGESSPTSRVSIETATTEVVNNRNAVERMPSQFNAAVFDRQSIRSSRSCSNISQRDLLVQDCSNAIALYNPYYPSQNQLAVRNEYVTLPAPSFPPPPPPSLFWYQQYMNPPLPPPLYFANIHQQMPADFQTFKRAMKLEKKKMEAESKFQSGACAQFCCSSVAQILWAIVVLACFGLLTALIFALFFI